MLNQRIEKDLDSPFRQEGSGKLVTCSAEISKVLGRRPMHSLNFTVSFTNLVTNRQL